MTIHRFPGVTTLNYGPDQILEASKGRLKEAVVIGFDTDGGEYFASSVADAGDVLYHLERARHRLMRQIAEMMGD